MLSLYLFGSPRLVRDGEQVHIGRKRSLALLIYLAATQRPHSREALANLLWSGYSHHDALANLRRELARLRKAIGGEHIVADRQQIALDSELWLDTVTFEIQLASGQIAEAIELAIDDFLIGFTLSDAPVFEEWVSLERERLRERLRHILEKSVEAALVNTASTATTAILHAQRWLALDPLHEPAHRALMRLYALTNQRNAALNQYEECVRLLAEELTVEPERETVALWEAIRNQTHETEGKTQRIAHNLPPETTPFIGRKTEITSLSDLLTTTRLVTITGSGGMGKTRLSQAVARRFVEADTFPDGVFFVELVGLQSADLIPSAIAQTLNIRAVHELHSYLRDKTMLLILDNFEHLLDGATAVERLLLEAPHLTILATSRERLRLRQEQLFPIWGLTAENEDAARELFLASAQRVDPAFEPSETDDADIRAICKLVEGMPLALELAASWIDMLSPYEIADEIRRNLDFLTTELVNVPDRHRSVRVAIDTSWQQLSAEQQRQFAQLSVFRGGFSREAAQAVAGVSLRSLGHFVNKSFLGFQREQKRYDIHEMLRQFSAEKLTANPTLLKQTTTAHATFYGNLLGDWDWFTTDQYIEPTYNAIEREIDNVRAAWHQLVANQQFDIIERGYTALARYYERSQNIAECMHLLTLALQHLPATYKNLRAELLTVQSLLLRVRAEYSRAATIAEEAIALGKEVGNERVIAVATFELAIILAQQGQLVLCQQKSQEALALARQAQLPLLEAAVLVHIGLLAQQQQDVDRAIGHSEQALLLFRKHESFVGEGWVLNSLGMLASERDQYQQALSYFQQSVAKFDQIDGRTDMAQILINQAYVEWVLGDVMSAITHAKESLTIVQQAGTRQRVVASLIQLGIYHTGVGLFDVAQAYLEEASALCKEIGAKQDLIKVLYRQGQLALQVGNASTAYDLAQEAIRSVHQHDLMTDLDGLMCVCGHALFEMGEYNSAKEAYQDALRLQQARGSTMRMIETLAGLARVLSATRLSLPKSEDQHSQALTYCEEILPHLPNHNNAIFDPFRADLTCYHVLAQVNDPRAATILRNAVDRLRNRAQQIYDYSLRRSYLEKIPTHFQIMEGASERSDTTSLRLQLISVSKLGG